MLILPPVLQTGRAFSYHLVDVIGHCWPLHDGPRSGMTFLHSEMTFMELLQHFTSHTVGYDDTFTRIHNSLNNMQFVSDWPVLPNQRIKVPTMSRPSSSYCLA